MSETTNADRAARGHIMALAYNSATRHNPSDTMDADELAGDMIADILHYAERDGEDGLGSAERAHRQGWGHYEEERQEEIDAQVRDGEGN